MEEKIFAGSLGYLAVKNRDEWRTCLANKRYEELDTCITKCDDRRSLKVKKGEKGKNSRPNTPEVLPKNEPKEYQDPGKFLSTTLDNEPEESDVENDEALLFRSERLQMAVNGLAIALAQVAQAVDQKYMKKPLGKSTLYIDYI
ncbi:hypothetical protein NQ314_013534 [Rhamnusium bicolor]|uniref:Uncharacterized protein n=1 Tax=Rhamnusium bicolor TaxID=1586634 RepID=A0AAV8X5J0_9CUCU|nr:hypothetical protein NQ314_013534 [Rhamnusium bicolor]